MGAFILDRRLKAAARGSYGPPGIDLVRDVRDWVYNARRREFVAEVLKNAGRPTDGTDVSRTPEQRAADAAKREQLIKTASESSDGIAIAVALDMTANSTLFAGTGPIAREIRKIDRQNKADDLAGEIADTNTAMTTLETSIRKNQPLVEPFKDMSFDDFTEIAIQNWATLRDLGADFGR